MALQTFRSVFRTNLQDPALLNAVLLAATLGSNGGVFDQDCLRYQLETIKTVRERVSLLDAATAISTLGAMLLLAGVEVSNPSSPPVAVASLIPN